jgi:hypothetical protein
MARLNERSIFTSLIFLFALMLLIDTSGMRIESVLVPRIMGGLLLLFSGLQMLKDWLPAMEQRLTFLSRDKSSKVTGNEDEDTEDSPETLKRRYLFIGWMALFAFLIYLIGMVWAIALALFLYLRWILKESWKMSIFYSLGCALAIYIIFVIGMGVHYLGLS